MLTTWVQGPAKINAGVPQDYLKTTNRKLPTESNKIVQVQPLLTVSNSVVKKFTYPDNDTRKPPVPRVSDMPQMGTQSNKNFVTTNATTNIMSG